MAKPIRIGVDIGGTFTDVVLEQGDRRHTIKALTTHDAPERAVLSGLADVMAAGNVVPGDVGLIIHGTTLATNALIERKGAKTALLTTEGFRDVLEIRAEDRYEQYDLTIDLPEPLVPRHLRFAVPERIDAKGETRIPLCIETVRSVANGLARKGVEAVAIGFLHSYLEPSHERQAAEILADALPDVVVSLSSEVAPEMREYERFTTASANAYVQPLIAGYLDRLRTELERAGLRCPLLMMSSGGGLTTIETAKRFPVRLVESGPAGGAAFAGDLARRHQLSRVLSFDMGGTTAKLCLIDEGSPQTSRGFEVARVWRFRKGSGLPLRIPVIDMVEIGAGGGSLARVDTLGRITVGPESAGSEPGPACYGRGGTGATVTDTDVLLGRIDPAAFAGGRMALDRSAAIEAMNLHVATPLSVDVRHAAIGVSELVEETMASAARVHAVEEGADVAGRTMIAFGGAAPLHAMGMAEKLGIDRVLIPKGAGVGSAIGFLRAPVAYEVVRSFRQALPALDAPAVDAMLDQSEAEAFEIVSAAAPGQTFHVQRKAFMRYVGQGHEIEADIPAGRLGKAAAWHLQQAFEDAYRRFYGRLIPDGEIECLAWSVTVSDKPPADPEPANGRADTPPVVAEAPDGRRALVDPATGETVDVPVYQRAALPALASIAGPSIITEDETTIVLPSTFTATIEADGTVDCRRNRGEAR